MMLKHLFVRAAALLPVGLMLASCGGGSSADAGSLTPFNIVPTSISLTGTGACPTGFAGRVYVYGGAGPYLVNNGGGGSVTGTGAAVLSLNKTLVDRPGDFFEVTIAPGSPCLTNIPIIVRDQLGRQVTLSVNSTAGP